MTQQQLRESVFKLIKTCVDKKAYIKGHGTMFRVMDENHSPVINITKDQMNVLRHNKIFKLTGLIYVLNHPIRQYTHYLEIELPEK